MINVILILSIFSLIIWYLYINNFIPKRNHQNAQIEEDNTQEETSKKQDISIIDILKNRVNLSWQFLHDIGKIISEKFSLEDKKTIDELGRVLYQAGMKYQHIVLYGFSLDYIKNFQKDYAKNKKKDGGRQNSI